MKSLMLAAAAVAGLAAPVLAQDRITVSTATDPSRPTELVVVNRAANVPMAGAAFGSGAAALLAAGPAGVFLAGIAGAAMATAAHPEPEVEVYVVSNPVPAQQLVGTLRVGNRIPPGATVYPVPDSDYAYLSVNGIPVLVEADDRRIVRIYN